MKTNRVAIVALMIAGLPACANLDRSRDLADPDVSGKTMAEQVCSACHGVDGNATSPAFPKLAGQVPAYVTNQLKNFRQHERSDPAGSEYMWGLSRHLTDAQIAQLSEYFAAQRPPAKPNMVADAALMAEGKEIFEKGIAAQEVIACGTCHGDKAQGMENFPRLAHQHADYIERQLDVFQSKHGRPGTPMDYVVHSLTPRNKLAVATYLEAFPAQP